MQNLFVALVIDFVALSLIGLGFYFGLKWWWAEIEKWKDRLKAESDRKQH